MYTFQMKCNRPLIRTTLLHFVTIFATVLLLVSCKKGDTGPAGAAGATGAQGPIGSANVKYSAWFTPTPWIKDTIFYTYGFNYTKATADITQSILDSGTVLTFGKLEGYNTAIWPTGTVSPLPIVINYKFSTAGITYTDTWSALATLGNLKIRFVDDQNYYSSIATSHQFRYIIIPGGVKSTAGASSSTYTRNGRVIGSDEYNANIQLVAKNYKQMTYNEICDRLGIPQ